MTPNAERLKKYKSKMSQAGCNGCPFMFAYDFIAPAISSTERSRA